MTIHLYIAYDYFYATTVELSSCDNEYMTHITLNIFYLALYKKIFFFIPALGR